MHTHLCGCENTTLHRVAMEVLAALANRRITRDEALTVLDDAVKLHRGNVSILHAVLSDDTSA
jgi:hypothetical protein